jgi:hypothetical protein
LHSFVKFALSLRQILTNNINFLIIVLIVFAKLFIYISKLFLKLHRQFEESISQFQDAKIIRVIRD